MPGQQGSTAAAGATVGCVEVETQDGASPAQYLQAEEFKEYGLRDPENKLIVNDLVRSPNAPSRGPASAMPLVTLHDPGEATSMDPAVESRKTRMVRFTNTIHALEPEAGTQGFQL